MQKTKINYLTHTWNPTHGCSPIATGCLNCWAETMSKRLAGQGVKGYSKDEPFKVVCCPEKLNEPLKKKKPSRIGVSFMGDLFHKNITRKMFHYIDDIFEIMAAAKQHIFFILTKRPDEMLRWYQLTNILGGGDYYKNIWLGVSVSTQEDADRLIPILLQIPAAVRFVSAEPMLEPVDLKLHDYCVSGNHHSVRRTFLDWIIIGCESSPKRRPCKTEWIENLAQQCEVAGVPCFIKQAEINGKVISMPEINGRVWNQYPKP